MNAPKIPNSIYSSVTDQYSQKSRSQRITERNTTSERLIVCLKKLTFAFFGPFITVVWLHPAAKVSERTNRNLPARNALLQLLALYTDPENQNAQRHRQTDDRITPIADHTV